MTIFKSPHYIIGVILTVMFLVGCGTSEVSPSIVPTLPAQNTLLPPQNPAQPVQPVGQPQHLKFIQTVQVTPDDQYLTGGFSRINYVPALDRFVITFGGQLAQPAASCSDRGFSYKFYTTDMQYAGGSGTFSCDPVDAGSVMVDNMYYFAAMSMIEGQVGWHLLKIDATSWTKMVDMFFPLDYPQEGDADPMVASVNGQIDISSAYTIAGIPPGPDTPAGEYGTHHHFFSTDLQLLGEKNLTKPPHINGSYMVYADGVYYLVTSNLYDGDVFVAKYDADWNYLAGKILIRQAHFSTGLFFDGRLFYLAYTDTSQRTEPGFFPVSLNIKVALFDRDWNLLEDVAVTDFSPQDNRQPGRPWLILHGNRLYVSYDIDTTDPGTRVEHLKGQAYVTVYELVQDAP